MLRRKVERIDPVADPAANFMVIMKDGAKLQEPVQALNTMP
jgi:hypothetical protein